MFGDCLCQVFVAHQQILFDWAVVIKEGQCVARVTVELLTRYDQILDQWMVELHCSPIDPHLTNKHRK